MNGTADAEAILQELCHCEIEEAIPICVEKFRLRFADGRVVVPEDSPARQLSSEKLLWVFSRMGIFFHFYGPQEKAFALYREISRISNSLPVKWQYYGFALFISHYMFLSKEEYFRLHAEYNKLFRNVWQFAHSKALHRRHEKIRIGYLSGDFRRHVVLLFIWALLTKYDRKRFEVYCFSTSEKEDDFSREIQKYVDGWIELKGMKAPQAAEEIYGREIDVLFELSGHSHQDMPILAYKPAPIQICGIGYFATTGLRTVDYFLTDKYLLQNGGEEYFVEKPLVMENSHFCFSPINDMPKEVKGAPCKQKGYITFGSFNDPLKINDKVLEAWSRILQRVPGAKLLMKGRVCDKEYGRKMLLSRLAQAGIEEARVELQGYTIPYLTVYWDVDIALDTFPYPGGGTTCDALYMGVPVITLGNGSHGGNFGISLLKNIGLDECCTYTLDEYIERAVLLASDPDLLDALHLGLRNMFEKSPVRDESAYVRELESKYEDVFQEYLNEG